MSLKALLFDLDGTVADTDHLHLIIWKDLLKPYGFDCDRDFFFKNISGFHNNELFAKYMNVTDNAEATRLSQEKEALFRKMAADPTLMFPTPGLIDLLKSANSASIRVHAVTNAPYENAVFMMEALDLNKYFEGVVIGERCARPKPFPDPYLAGLSCVDAQPQNTIVFEDSPTGIRAAVAAGIKVVAIATHQSHDVLKNAGASYIVKDFTGLTLPILEGYLQ